MIPRKILGGPEQTMVELIPPPEPHHLLPPLLACLPTAFASSRPPPALLSLLSPILRQRLELISSTSTSNTDNWLRLLCWNNAKTEALREAVENATFEPHPSSGEIEVGDVGTIEYKRFDQETLRAQIPLPEWHLMAIYLWCVGGQGDNGWKLAELLPYDGDAVADGTWSTSIREANETSRDRILTEALQDAEAADRKLSVGNDDDYWAMYDKSPGRTPAKHRSPAPNLAMSSHLQRYSSDEYYDQYASVQPAMDSHDATEEVEDPGESSLNGNALQALLGRHSEDHGQGRPPAYQDAREGGRAMEDRDGFIVSQPQPSSPSSIGGSDTVARLEETAERQATSEIGIRQHISSSMKSMFRLAKTGGIDREEFERLVHRELETLSILDGEMS